MKETGAVREAGARPELSALLGQIIDLCLSVSAADAGTIQICNSASSALEMVAYRNSPRWLVELWDRDGRSRGICFSALESRKRLTIEDVEKSPKLSDRALQAAQIRAGFRSIRFTPLISSTGKPLGIFTTHHRNPKTLGEHELQLLDRFAGHAADVIEQIDAVASRSQREENVIRPFDVDSFGMILVEPGGTIAEANDAFLKMTGYGHADIRGQRLTWSRLNEVEQRQHAPRSIEFHQRIASSVREYFLKDGSRRWMQFSGLDLGDANVLGICFDVTDYLETDSALHLAEARFRALVTASPSIFFRMSPDWRTMYALEGKGLLADITSPASDWLERYVYSDDRSHVMETVQHAIVARRAFALEHRVRCADGSVSWARSRAEPLFDRNGEITEWLGIATDQSEHKRAESELFEGQQRFEALMRALPVGVAIAADPGCERVAGNPALLALLDVARNDNVSAAQDIHAFWNIARLHNGRKLSDADLPLRKAVREGRTIPAMELQFQLPNGRNVFAEVSAAPIRDAAGKVVGGVAVILDLTVRREAQEQRKEAHLKDEFLAVLGHELRNPLAAISNAMQLLSTGVADAMRLSLEALVQRQVGILRRLVDDLLDVSRITHGQILLQKEPIDLATLLRDASAAAQPMLNAHSHELVVRPPISPVQFVADAVRINQIVANLLDNAAKYTDKGGRVELSGEREGAEVVVRCKDSGGGIPLEMQQRIFEPLARLESTIHAGSTGLGLGLTLVKGLTESHGGKVSVTSGGIGAGSEFVVRIPFVPADPTQTRVEKAGGSGAPVRRRSFLIVDDNADVSETLTLALEQAGHRVTRFPDGPSALSVIRDIGPDVVLLDIGLPGMDGYEVLARMKKWPELSNTLFIGVSGFPQSIRTGKVRVRFDDYLIKPVTAADVMKLLGDRPGEESGRHLRALVIEDYPDLAAATAELLRHQGLEVLVAVTAQQAFESAAAFQPQLVLCDMNLPDMKGLDAIRKLRLILGDQRTRMVVITAQSEARVRAYNRGATQAGVDEFVAKPITPDIIRALIENMQASENSDACMAKSSGLVKS